MTLQSLAGQAAKQTGGKSLGAMAAKPGAKQTGSGKSFGAMETWEPPDKSFSKHILRTGEGDSQPNEGSQCTIYLNFIEKTDIKEEELGGYKTGEDIDITIGEGDCVLADLFDTVLLSMKEGETAYIKAKVDVDGNKVGEHDTGKTGLKFNMALKSFNRRADSEDLEQDERLENALHHKEKGTELYQKGKVEEAIKRYTRSLKFLKDMRDDKEIPDNMLEQYKRLRSQGYLNLAAIYLKQDKYDDVIMLCCKALALDESNVKGLFRRGQAHVSLHHYPDAKADFSRIIEIEPENKAVINQLRNVENLIKKEKDTYKKMFSS